MKTLSAEEKLMAAIGHLAVFLPVIGVIVPAIVWLTQNEKTSQLKAQSLQALVHQVLQGIIFIVLYILSMALYLLSLFPMVLLDMNGSMESFSPAIILFFIGMFAMFACLGLIMISSLYFQITGIVAFVQILRGKEGFHYPFAGRWVARRSHLSG